MIKVKFRQQTQISRQIYVYLDSRVCYFRKPTKSLIRRKKLIEPSRVLCFTGFELRKEEKREGFARGERSEGGNSFWASFCMKISWLKGRGERFFNFVLESLPESGRVYRISRWLWKLLKFELDRVSTIDSGIGQLFFIVRIISCLIIV